MNKKAAKSGGKRLRSESSGPIGELSLIASIRARKQSRNTALRLGIGDDCALIRPGQGEEVAVTTDFSLENVHFRRDWHSPESVGHRCLARGMSDLAAMGARPLAAFVSLALPRELATGGRQQHSWVERFYNGLLALADRLGVSLAGGDTAESPAFGGKSGLVAADIVAIGGVRCKRALLRSEAQAGDVIYVTGALGGAAAELSALERNPGKIGGLTRAGGEHPHLFPEPRVAVGERLAGKRLATAAIDLSDGLSTDLRHLCEESDVSAEIDSAAIPVHPMARLAEAAGWTPSALDLALHGGEDYELLFTASPKLKIPKSIAGVPVHPIGEVGRKKSKGAVVTLVGLDGIRRQLESAGWEHLR